MNLKGLRVLNTRPKRQAFILTKAITQLKGISIECPGLVIEPLSLNWTIDLSLLSSVDKIIFTSAYAVDYFFKGLIKTQVLWPIGVKIFAIGHATAKAFTQVFPNLKVHAVPVTADSQTLIQLPDLLNLNQQRVLLVKGVGGLSIIANHLQAQSCHFHTIEVYRRLLPKIDACYIQSIWKQNAVDIILFTSQELMDNIFRLFGVKAQAWLKNKPCLVISQRLSQAATDKGIKTVIECKPEAIIGQLLQFNQGLNHGSF